MSVRFTLKASTPRIIIVDYNNLSYFEMTQKRRTLLMEIAEDIMTKMRDKGHIKIWEDES
jgi:ribosomal protein L10